MFVSCLHVQIISEETIHSFGRKYVNFISVLLLSRQIFRLKDKARVTLKEIKAEIKYRLMSNQETLSDKSMLSFWLLDKTKHLETSPVQSALFSDIL